jgi:mRNA interferase MazF
MPGKYSRGDVVPIDLDIDKPKGSESNKTRPCVVIGQHEVAVVGSDTGVVVQNDVGNRFSTLTIVVCITGAENVTKKYPVDVPIPKGEGGLLKDSVAQCNIIKSVDEKRLGTKWGTLKPQTMMEINKALKISLAL